MERNIFEKANNVFLNNFKPETGFERAIFFSWYCSIRDCKYCYMSTQDVERTARRTVESILAEVLICKNLGWDIGFISGGHKAYSTVQFRDILKKISLVRGDKLWINVGALKKEEIEEFRPFIKGVVGAIEIIDPELHDQICPSKPIDSMVKMFNAAEGLQKGMTIILGLGEKKKDFGLLKKFIQKNKITKIHFYSLNPQKGTVYENQRPVSKAYHAWWIAKTRIEFPKINIQAGIWVDKVENVSTLLLAGANSISKFPSIKQFNSSYAKTVEEQASLAGRKFRGSLTKIPLIDWDEEISNLNIERELKKKMGTKLKKYLEVMRRSKG